MKKNIYLMLGVTLLLFVWTSTVVAAEKIAFMNLQEVIQNSIVGKKSAEEFKKYYEKKQESIKAMESEVRKLKEELDKQGSVMTASARSDKESAYQRKLRDYQLLVEDSNKELQKRDQEYSKKMIPEILKVVRAIGEREKYTMIIDISTTPIPYHDKGAEITKRIIDEYNRATSARK